MTYMLSDFFIIFYWWSVLLILGLLLLPFTLKLFNKFWDKGWVFSKTLGILLISYLIFILGRLHVLPFYRQTIFLIILLLLGANIWWLNKKENKKYFIKKIKENWKIFVFEEVLFFLMLAFWSFIRGFQPDIEGLEKFMDFGFVNSILRAEWFPPKDMWFAGHTINYYYFGHLIAAVLTKLSGLSSLITYNLMIATLFAFAFVGTFSLSSNLVYLFNKKTKVKNLVVLGLFSAFLLSLGGNLHTIVYVLKEGKDNYWYPDATRFIGYKPDNPNDKTIHEFPSYSFVVSDLHGHVSDIPNVLFFLAVLLVLGANLTKNKKKLLNSNSQILVFILSWSLALMYMTNSWNFPIYGVLFAVFIFLIFLFQVNKFDKENVFNLFKKVFVLGFLTLILAIIFALPFAISFNPPADGIGFVNARSLWWQLLILWGFFWFIAVSFWILVVVSSRPKWRDRFLKLKRDSSATLGMTPVSDLFVLAGTIWATILIIIPEIIYVKDIYIASYHRSNTMFKLVYQSFCIYSISAGYIFWRVKKKLKSPLLYTLYSILFLIGFSCQMIYPYFAIKGYYGRLKKYKGLYGMNFLKRSYPDSFYAVNWLRNEVEGQPVILEATGDSYTLYDHTSAMTGLPTVEGWVVHEWLWRGGYDKPGARREEVRKVYEGESLFEAKKILKKYKVKYVMLGDIEREEYKNLKELRFDKLGRVIFSSGNTKIYLLDK